MLKHRLAIDAASDRIAQPAAEASQHRDLQQEPAQASGWRSSASSAM
jgi:hypothetical protein